MRRTAKDDHLLWLDLETTGMDETHDCIIEAAYDGKTHRALDDARCHLAEARDFAAMWNREPVAS